MDLSWAFNRRSPISRNMFQLGALLGLVNKAPTIPEEAHLHPFSTHGRFRVKAGLSFTFAAILGLIIGTGADF